MEIIIRQETEADHEEVYRLVREAFAHAEHSDGTEHDLVVRLRRSSAFVPSLSLVAEHEHRIVGHIIFTKVHVGNAGDTALALAPLSVMPSHWRMGIGRALVEAGHGLAGESGFGWSIVLGDPLYYGRSGYERADEYGIIPPFDVPPECYMCIRLRRDAVPVCGMVRYAEEFL